MSYNDEALRAKLSSLQESQDSIVNVAQWIMFHKRHADRTAQLWLERLREANPPKRLNLVYLANEVVQQSKARKRDDFARAFGPIIVEAMTIAFKGATVDLQQKLGRVVAVWRDRSVFEPAAQDLIEAQMKDVDKSRDSGRKARLGGSLGSSDGSAAHPDLQPITTVYASLAKSEPVAKSTTTAALNAYGELNKPDAPVLTPNARAARLTTLLKSLASAESGVGDAIKARRSLISSLEKLLDAQRGKLTADEDQAGILSNHKASVENQKRLVEAEIMRSIEDENSEKPEPERPEEEPLTPPPVESLTPIGSPREGIFAVPAQGPNAIPNPSGADILQEHPHTLEPEPPAPPANEISTATLDGITQPTNTILDPRRVSGADSFGLNGQHPNPTSSDPRLAKRQRVSSHQGDEFAAFADGANTAMAGMDADIDAMLNT